MTRGVGSMRGNLSTLFITNMVRHNRSDEKRRGSAMTARAKRKGCCKSTEKGRCKSVSSEAAGHTDNQISSKRPNHELFFSWPYKIFKAFLERAKNKKSGIGVFSPASQFSGWFLHMNCLSIVFLSWFQLGYLEMFTLWFFLGWSTYLRKETRKRGEFDRSP